MKIDLSNKNIMAYILTWLVIGILLIINIRIKGETLFLYLTVLTFILLLVSLL
jgi:hypothetical protein